MHEVPAPQSELHQITKCVLLLSSTLHMIAVALGSHVSARSLNKAAQIPLLFHWSPVIISCFGTELDSWGCCLYVTPTPPLPPPPLGGNHNGKLQAMVTSRVLSPQRTLSGTTPGAQTCRAHESGRKLSSERDNSLWPNKGASPLNWSFV